MTTANDLNRTALEGASGMNERIQELADRFEQANAEATAAVERLSAADWQKRTGEGWTVAATAHHIAIVHEGIVAFVAEVANGTARQRSEMGSINESNARHAEEYAVCSKDEVLAEMRSRGAAAAAILRGLTDAQLDRVTDAIPGMPVVSTERIIEMALIGHVTEHLNSIKRAVAG